MLRLKEALLQKIHLHIRQDMLQRLWDKYVPSDSAEYGDIQLIYLGQETRQPAEQSQRIQLLINLVLKNRVMRMELDKIPVRTAFVREQMKGGLQRMEKYYLMQLKCCDFVLFRKVNRYVELLAQAEAGDRRCREWQRENKAIEDQREEYRLFSLFSSEIKEFLEKRSYAAMRAIERELLYTLSEKEYQRLSENVIWQERETFLSCLEKCNEIQCNKMIKRLQKNGGEIKGSLFQRQNTAQDMETSQNRLAGKELAEIVRTLEPQKYLLFYQRAVSVLNETAAGRQIAVWKKKKEKMLRYVKREQTLVIRQLLAQMEKLAISGGETADGAAGNMAQVPHIFSEKLIQLEQQYFREVIKEFRQQVVSLLGSRTYHKVARRAQHFLWEETAEQLAGEERLMAWQQGYRAESRLQPEEEDYHRESGLQPEKASYDRESKQQPEKEDYCGESRLLTMGVRQITERIEQEVKNWGEQLEQREAQAFVLYQNAYREVLGTVDIVDRHHQSRLVKELFQYYHRGEFAEQEVQKICEWSKALVQLFAEVPRQSSDGYSEMSEHPKEMQKELIFLIKEISYALKEQDESIEETSLVLEGQDELAERVVLSWQSGSKEIESAEKIENTEKIHELLSYFHGLEEKKQPEFIGNLAETMSIWRWVSNDFAAQEIEGMLQMGEELFEKQNKDKIPEMPEDVNNLNVPYSKLWEWGKALLFHQNEQISDRQIEEGFYQGAHALPEKSQTDIIRRQIETAKDRNSLQQLIAQVNHKLFLQIENPEESGTISQPGKQTESSAIFQPGKRTESSVIFQSGKRTESSVISQPGMQEDILVYAESQLAAPPVRELLHFLQELDEKQYGILIEQLSQIAKLQWQQNSMQELNKAVNLPMADIAYLRTEGNMEAEPSHIAALREQDSRQLAAAYPELALRIQKFEEHRGTFTSKELQQWGDNLPAYRTVMGSSREMQEVLQNRGEIQNIVQKMQETENIRDKARRSWELQYSMQTVPAAGAGMQEVDMRMREQTMQINSVQDQLGKKLQEVEQQLKKVETASKAQEDVRAFADQVKRQLYEELHVEKLRRGLI